MLTKKCKYGLKAMIYMSQIPEKSVISVAEVAKIENIPRKFLDSILSELKNSGLVDSRRGKGGGYWLARPAHDITIGSIIRALDGPLAPIPCASKLHYKACLDCDVETCATRRLMSEVRDAMAAVLDRRTLYEASRLPYCPIPETFPSL